ncbi:hypothetical protein BC835DRAFT_1411293 [Cytidiella melzeri]|nr:hypothetical protein BC835DRAFT_1411293 [Cytidiella melzeri]
MSSHRDAQSPSRSTGAEQCRTDATSRRSEDSTVVRDAQSHGRPPTPTRQAYHSRLASYSWSRYKSNANGPNSPPLLFVEYRDSPLSSIVNTEPKSLSSVSRQRIAGPSSPKHTSLSAVTASSAFPRERTMPYPRPIPMRQSSGDSITVHSESSQERVTPSGDRELKKQMEIDGQHPRVRRSLRASPSWPNSSESESSCPRSPSGQGSAGHSRHSTADPEADQWTRHAKALDRGGSSAKYACTWVDTTDNILERPCGYVSKKHLVKRHIESKHLQIKPITCEICGKGFSQRTNYATHMNTHTGAAPHKCPFDGCDATFGDPARRHRHMKTVHNHQPSKRRTQTDNDPLVLDMDVSEPEEEDSS